MTDERQKMCRTCVYRCSYGNNGNKVLYECDYLLITGHSRIVKYPNDKPTECSAYEKGKKIVIKNFGTIKEVSDR